MTPSNPTYEYQDQDIALGVDLPADPTGTIRLRAASDTVGTTIALSIMGAQRLTQMLSSAITVAIARGIG